MLMSPLSDAEREFKNHERELWEQLLVRVRHAAPPEATVKEAIEAVQRATDDPGIEDLIARVLSIAEMGGGTFLKQKLAAPMPPPQGEPVYQLADQPTKSIVQEEIRLMDLLRREIDARIGIELEGKERRDRIHQLFDEDESLATLAERLDKLSRSHDESVMLGLARLTEEEAEEEEEEF